MVIMQRLFAWGGHDCVTVFICLSGFSLTMSLAKSEYRTFLNPGNLKNYFIRRFLRIAPPYYCAILGILVLAAVFPSLSVQTPTNWSFALPILSFQSVVYHLFFVHALDPSQVFKISPQFWSIGTEFQLYAWLPFVLVPLAMRKSMMWGLFVATVAALIFVSIKSFDRACLHFVLTFSLGAFAADQIYNPQSKDKPINAIALACLAGFVAAVAIFGKVQNSFWAPRDLILSPLMAFGLYCLVKGKGPTKLYERVRKALSSSVMVFLGKISYSLYLVHYVIIGAVHAFLVGRGASVHVTVVSLIVVAPLLSRLIAKLMQIGVEAPSMNFAKRFRDIVPDQGQVESPK
jgi:peptidoglycan/LPS O-acetylase OafA/YrhL